MNVSGSFTAIFKKVCFGTIPTTFQTELGELAVRQVSDMEPVKRGKEEHRPKRATMHCLTAVQPPTEVNSQFL